MKNIIIATFHDRVNAERAINRLHGEVGVPTDEISYVYRNIEGQTREVDAGEVSASTPSEGAATGAAAGGIIGALAGFAVIAGIIPVVGPIFVAGPLVALLGVSSAVGTAVAGAATGAVAGGLIGALVSWGVGEKAAKRYEDSVMAGNILVVVHSEKGAEVSAILAKEGGRDVDVFLPVPVI